jgi:D-galactarolactone cycloisomerase
MSTLDEQVAGSELTAAGNLTISRIETIAVRAPLAREFRGSFYHMAHRATMITRIYTKEGLVGEAYTGDEDAGLREIERIMHAEIAPVVTGMNAFALERCWQAAYPVTYDILRDRRLGLVALAALDTALWDLVGKALGQPLWRLWGGYSNRVPMISIGGYHGNVLGPLVEEMASYREMGLAGCKVKVGGRSQQDDVDRVRVVRGAMGPDFVLAVDANQGYTVEEALSFAHGVQDLDLAWFEEPVQWHNDRRSLQRVRFGASIPITAGQSEFSPSGCRDLMESGSIDICNFDASWSGGPTAWRRTAAIAHSYDVRMGHHEEPQVSCHLLASQSHSTFAECFHPDRDPFWWNLVANRPPLVDGYLTLSDDPGLGWQLDWDYINKHRLDA